MKTPAIKNITAVTDVFSGTEVIKVKAPNGTGLLRIEAGEGVIDKKLLAFLSAWTESKRFRPCVE